MFFVLNDAKNELDRWSRAKLLKRNDLLNPEIMENKLTLCINSMEQEIAEENLKKTYIKKRIIYKVMPEK